MTASLRLIDSHAHLDFPEFDSDRDAVFAAMSKANISSCIIPGVSPAHWDRQLQVARQYACSYGLGLHPWYVDAHWQRAIDDLSERLDRHRSDKKLVAVGECGLDKIRDDNWQWQLQALEAQLLLASKHQLPVILHSVKSHEPLISLLSSHSLPRRGVIHGFYGSVEVAKRYIELGYLLGIGGLLLNEDAKKLHKVVETLPIESFICETDSPSMAPKSARGSRNSPLLIGQIVTKMAHLQKKSNVLISERLLASVTQLFEL